jgi:hypothetical protein
MKMEQTPYFQKEFAVLNQSHDAGALPMIGTSNLAVGWSTTEHLKTFSER